jgi:hypothetical protein
MGRTCSTNGERRNAYRILVGKSEVIRLLARYRYRSEGKIKLYLRVTGWG